MNLNLSSNIFPPPHSMTREQLGDIHALLSRQLQQIVATTPHERLALIEEQATEVYAWGLAEYVKAIGEQITQLDTPPDAQVESHLGAAEQMSRSASRHLSELLTLKGELGKSWSVLEHIVGAARLLRYQPNTPRDERGRFLSLSDQLDTVGAELEKMRKALERSQVLWVEESSAEVGAVPPSGDAAAEAPAAEVPAAPANAAEGGAEAQDDAA